LFYLPEFDTDFDYGFSVFMNEHTEFDFGLDVGVSGIPAGASPMRGWRFHVDTELQLWHYVSTEADDPFFCLSDQNISILTAYFYPPSPLKKRDILLCTCR
jgi:hypothetical protein